MAIARGIGQVSYRTPGELEARFGHNGQDGESPLQGGRYSVESYLEHHGDKLAGRFDPNSYIVLSEAMNSHDVGRGHGRSARHRNGEVSECAFELKLFRKLRERFRPDHHGDGVAAVRQAGSDQAAYSARA